MEHGETSTEQLTNIEVVPNLLELIVVVENPEPKSVRTIVYCPPIMGSSIDRENLLELAQKAKAIYAIEIQKYGYPYFDQYILQAKQKLEELTNFDPKDLVLVGFSQGASLAARLGQAFELPRENVFLLAPITSFRPPIDRWKAWREQRRYKENTNQISNDEPYLKRLLGSPQRLYSPSDKISKIDQFRALNRSRTQWSSNADDLTRGLVVTGNRDFISPPGRHSSVNINASHRLNDYMAFLNETLK